MRTPVPLWGNTNLPTFVAIALIFALCTIISPTCANERSIADRRIHLKIVDESQVPVAHSHILAASLSADKLGRPAADYQSETSAEGLANIEIKPDVVTETDEPILVFAWKPGRALRYARVHTAATLATAPEKFRELRIESASREPVAYARVRVDTVMVAGNRLPLPASWQQHFSATTDERGVCRLPYTNDQVIFVLRIEMHSMLPQFVMLGDWVVSPLRASHDPRDTTFIRLAETGDVQGSLPPWAIENYRLRLVPMRYSTSNRADKIAYSETDIDVDSAGKFRLTGVAVGEYVLRADLKRPLSSKLDDTDNRVLTPLKTLAITPDTTTDIEWASIPSTLVTGHVITSRDGGDEGNISVVVAQFDGASDLFPEIPLGLVEELACDAQGNYSVVLPEGQYRFQVSKNHDGTQMTSASAFVGPGAAMIRVADLRMPATQRVRVRIAESASRAFQLLGASEVEFSARYAGDMRLGCSISIDGQGVIEVPHNLLVHELTLSDVVHPLVRTRVVDLDPSPDFELALDEQPTGQSTNVALHVRVTDQLGHGLPNMPVCLLLNSEIIRASGESFSGNTFSRRLMQGLRTDRDGRLQLPPFQVFAHNVLINRDMRQRASPLKITLTMTAGTADEEFRRSSSHFLFEGERWTVPRVIDLPDIVSNGANRRRVLSGRLLTAQGEPRQGEIVWLSDGWLMLRDVTDSAGRFQFDSVSDKAWLLVAQSWNIHRVANLQEPCELRSTEEPTVVALSWQRMPLEQRRQLAKVQIDKLSRPQPGLGMVSQLPPEAFLKPEQYAQLLSQPLADPMLDVRRQQFVTFWPGIDDEPLKKLADVTSSGVIRARLLMLLGDRQHSRELYERAMDAIEIPIQTRGRKPPNDPAAADLVSELGLRLFRLGGLGHHAGKLQDVIDTYAKSMANPRLPSALPEPTSIQLCRALLEPDRLLARVEEIEASLAQTSARSITEARTLSPYSDLPARMFPQSISKRSIGRLSSSETLWRDLGEFAPNITFEQLKHHPSRLDELLIVSEATLRRRAPEAEVIFEEVARRLRETETSKARITYLATMRLPALQWTQAARAYSPALGRQAGWHLAQDYLRSLQADAFARMPITGQEDWQALVIALSLVDYFPDLAEAMIEPAAKKLVAQIEEDSKPSFTRRYDLRGLAYFYPEQAVELLDRLSTIVDEAVKVQAPNRPAHALVMNLVSLRISCLRGLLQEPDEIFRD